MHEKACVTTHVTFLLSVFQSTNSPLSTSGHSSDSEDLPVTDPSNKLTPIKHSSIAKAQKRSPGTVSPNSKELDKDKHKDKQSFPSPRTYKWTFQHSK